MYAAVATEPYAKRYRALRYAKRSSMPIQPLIYAYTASTASYTLCLQSPTLSAPLRLYSLYSLLYSMPLHPLLYAYTA